MEKRLLRFGRYENVTKSGQDGATIQFPFSMLDSSMVGIPDELQVTTWHRLRVSVAGGISWGDNDVFLAKVLFAVGKQEVAEKLRLQGGLLELETVFVPHGDCSVDPKTLIDPEGSVVELEIS